MAEEKTSFLKSAGIYLKPASIRMFFLGFSSGLPLLLILGTLAFRMREAGTGLAFIGFMSWVGLIYAVKWLWAPFVDRMRIPLLTERLGRRRAVLLLAQVGLVAGIASIGIFDPADHLYGIIGAALFTGFCSATQDIALDAYRIESAELREQGVLAASYQFGYRIAMIWTGAGALAVAAAATPSGAEGYVNSAWSTAYLVMAASEAIGIAAVLASPEASGAAELPAVKRQTVAERVKTLFFAPLADFCRRYGKGVFILLGLVATYRISDVVMGIMANPFYADMGFTKEEVALVIKVFGVVMTLAGTFAGGLAVLKIGVMKTLFLGSVLSALTNILYSLLAAAGHSVPFLAAVVSADNLAGGLASAAFVAFLSGLTNREFSATQYAVLSSVMLLLPKTLAGFSGVMVEHIGYSAFFIFTAAIGIPVAFLVILASRLAAVKN